MDWSRKRPATNSSLSLSPFRLNLLRTAVALLLLLSFQPMTTTSNAYRVGDAVDTDLQIDSSSASSFFGLSNTDGPRTSATLRSQMPKFGVDTVVNFSKKNDLAQSKSPTGFTLLFEDGLRTLEHVHYKNHLNLYLTSMTVWFVYSKSGTCVIHSVLLKDKEYTDKKYAKDGNFQVEYVWKEEAPVRLLGGFGVMFLMVFVTSILLLMQTCAFDEDEEEHVGQRRPSRPKKVAAYGGYRKHND